MFDRLFENLRMLPHAPGVQIQTIPEDAINDETDEEDKADKDERITQTDKDKRIVPDNEFSDSEDEGEGGRRDNRSYKGQRKRPRLEKESKVTENSEAQDDKEKSEKPFFNSSCFKMLIIVFLVFLICSGYNRK